MVITKSFNLDINTPWKAPTLYIKQGDVDSRKLQATIRKDGTNYSIPGDVFATFRMHKPDDTFVTQDCTISGSVVSVVMDAQCATAAGHGKAEFILQTASEVVSTFLLAIEILPSAVSDGDIESRDALGEYRTILEEMLRVKGAPLVANTAADMTDMDRVYVYTGSEVGYVNGSWYYYDGAAWTLGGVYNSQAIGLDYQQEVAHMVKQSAVASESDSTPYLFRPTPNPSAILADEEIVGGTVAWNQLVQNGDFSSGTTNWTRVDSQSVSISVSDGVLKVTATGSSSQGVYATIPEGIVGHAYLAVLQIKAETAGHQLGVAISQASLNTNTIVPIFELPTTWTTIAGIKKVTTASQYRLRIAATTASAMAVNDFFSLKNVILIDLTAAFGSTIADYLNTLESGTAGAGVAKLREWGFLSKEYYAYDAGSLKSVNTEGKEVTGANECYYEPGTAYNIYNGGHLIPVKAGEKIYVYGEWTYTSSASMWGGIFATPTETNKNNKLVQLSNFTAGSVKTYDITMDGYFGVAFNAGVNTYDVTKMMISRINTTYQPYRSTTYHTTPTDLNGIFKLDANNQLYADGDRYKSDGTIQRIYYADVIDGGANLTVASVPQHSSGYYYCAIGISSAYTAANNTNLFNDGGYSAASGVVPGHIYEASGGSMIVVVLLDQTITTPAAANAYFASHPLHIVYELASAKQTTDTANTYAATQIVGKGGTERWIDNRSVPVPVGHRTQYYIGVPDVPANASNATLKATVSEGKTTLSWS